MTLRYGIRGPLLPCILFEHGFATILLGSASESRTSNGRPQDLARFLHGAAQSVFRTMKERCEQVSELIVSYLGKHPEAQDTLEGIASWWLTFERIDLSTTVVAQALESLVGQGIVTLRISGDGTALYGLNRCNGSVVAR